MSTAVIGAPEFRARSGRTVRAKADGSVVFDHVNGYLGPEQVFDAEEFFQARRDLELGRWRYPLNPDYVVYVREPYPGELRRVRAIQESTGDFVDTVEGTTLDGPFKDAARAYFEAHPERKPWEDAKPGEFWALKLPMATIAAASQDETLWQVDAVGATFVSTVFGPLPLTSGLIADARLVWSGVAS
jgi:hypothetical protein